MRDATAENAAHATNADQLGGLAGGGMRAGIGAAAGAAAGLAAVFSRRGPDVVLPKGTSVEMVLDRDLHFRARELRPGN